MKLLALLLFLGVVGCKKSPPPPVPAPKKKKTPPIKAPPPQKAALPSFPLEHRYKDFVACTLTAPCEAEPRVLRELPLFPKSDLDASVTALTTIYKTADPKARAAAVWMLRFLNLPQRWIDLVDEWIRKEQDPTVRYHLYRFLTHFPSPRADRMLQKALHKEPDFLAFKGAVKAALQRDKRAEGRGSTLLLQALPQLKGMRARFVLLNIAILPKSDILVHRLTACRDQRPDLSGQCALTLSKHLLPENFTALLSLLKNPKKRPTIYHMSALTAYAAQPGFPKDKVMRLLFSIAKNSTLDRELRQGALGEIGKLGTERSLTELMDLVGDKTIAEAARRAQWRVRKRARLPNLNPLPPLRLPPLPNPTTSPISATLSGTVPSAAPPPTP